MKDKQTILIIDDIKENIDVLMQFLSMYDLIPALNGQTAIDIANEEENIDLILLDIMMPNLDGFEVCKVLKNIPKLKYVPIIFLSAKSKQEDIQKAFEIGGSDYITKPFYPNELLSRVNTHLKLRAYEKDLESKIQEEVQKNLLKEQMICQQSKQAALGELLMHITHQWKQPLSSLSSINILNKAKIEAGIPISSKDNLKSIKKSEDIIMFMSETINTFKNFYIPTNGNKSFYISESVADILSIIEATFYFDNIKIYVISHEIKKTFGNINEFSQVIFSILNNARDIFRIRDIKIAEIHILIETNKISIKDNAGGIDEDLLKDIFLPSISTKDGSGIGLYLSRNIIKKNGGTITASNSKDGAVFNIDLSKKESISS
ncbi:MAG: hybrid sensor histidine kinase/response regulator [Sulfurimonas sp.]|nr:hybrid sensor histidine kinase/response regulator [Sulfurimonas sp.]